MCLAAFDFSLKRGNARIKFVQRERIQVLLSQHFDRIIGTPWKILVNFHNRQC